MRRALLALAAAAVVACGTSSPPGPQTAAPHATTPVAPPHEAVSPRPAPAPAEIVFIDDDYARALAEAKAKKLPLFVDVWAPWCHTCLSMRAYVFPDGAMRRRAGEFVWLAIDHENDKNEEFLAKHPSEVLPTLWVIDPATEKPVLKWLGSATPTEVSSLLDDAVTAIQNGDAGGEAGAALLRANQLTAEGKRVEAVREYQAALAAAPASWSRRPEAIDALTERLLELKRYGECVDLALAEMPKMPPGTALADVAQTAITAAYGLPESDASKAKMKTLIAFVRKLAEDASLPILPDDRSSLFDHVVDALEDFEKADAPAVAREWATFLEGEAAKAGSPAARVVFDSHRVAAYIAMGQPERALPMLEESARDFPKDYNPPARMVVPLMMLKRYPEALAASDRALALVYGPRTLRVLANKADVYKAMGDRAGEKRTVQAALDAAKTMYGVDGMRAALEKRLATL